MTADVPESNQIGVALAQRLGLELPKTEGHDLAGPCISCKSSDAFRLHMRTGVAQCYSCQGKWSPFQLAESVIRDREQAKSILVDVGLFKPHPEANGKVTPPDPIGAIARQKGITADSLRSFGAKAITPTMIHVPCYGPDGKPCTTFTMSSNVGTQANKGLFAKRKPAGLFLPHIDGQVRLPQSGEVWHLVEGVKDASALHSLGLLAAGLPSSTMNAKFAQLFAGVNAILVPDRDSAGERGASMTAGCLYGVAATVRVATLPAEFKRSKGEDVRDVLKKEGGRDLVLKAIADARPWEAGKSGQNTNDGRPEIEVTPDEHLVNDKAVAALNHDDSIFQRAGTIVRILRDHSTRTLKGITRPANTPRIVPLRDASLRERLSAAARFVKRRESEDGEEIFDQVHPPAFCVAAVGARGHWPSLRHLEGVISSPVLRTDGTVLQEPGYDPVTGLYYEPAGQVIEVPASPTYDDARAAGEALLEVVADFPFASPAHRAAWLAFVLTPLSRRAFAGSCPLFLIDANIRASGKSLLADVASLIVTGREIARMSCPEDDDETRKRITAITLNGDQMVLIDNIAGELGSASLDAALTGTVWKDRILGRSEIVEMPLVTIWAATGNNVVLMGDIPRRVCHIRLNSQLERPEERADFKHANLRTWVQQERPRLLAEALTVLSAYCRAGRPDQSLKPWGSFEGWSDLVRQAIVWIGQPDPGETREELARSSDREAAALRGLIQGLREIDPDGTGIGSAKLIDRLEKAGDSCEILRNAVLELCPAPAGKLPGPRSLGNKLRHLLGRVVGGQALDRRDLHGTALWFVRNVGPGAGGKGCSGGSGCSGNPDMGHPLISEHSSPVPGEDQKSAATEQLEQPEQPLQASSTSVGLGGAAWEEGDV